MSAKHAILILRENQIILARDVTALMDILMMDFSIKNANYVTKNVKRVNLIKIHVQVAIPQLIEKVLIYQNNVYALLIMLKQKLAISVAIILVVHVIIQDYV